MHLKINLTSAEENKSRVINLVVEKQITNAEAATQLGVTVRQIKRLKQKMKTEGINGIIHGLKGKVGNHRVQPTVKEKALSLITEKYPDFKPGFAAEKLQEEHHIPVSPDTVLRWMTEVGLWKSRKNKAGGQHRTWRPRREYYGDMQQFDGSYHLWLEDRYTDSEGNSIELCLLAAIDDATGKITKACFAANEGVTAVFQFWKAYILLHGKPLLIYFDRFSTYKVNHKAAVDNIELMTQFGRTCTDLTIEIINAHSPQAKGRIERLFGTLQDRLVKEMRLANITTPEEANIFLTEVFIPKFNKKFEVTPAKDGDAHQPLTTQDRKDINRIFSVQSTRTVNQDFTIQFQTKWYQLKEIQPTTIRPKQKVTVEQWFDGTIHFSCKGNDLSYLSLPARPPKQKTNPAILTTHKLNWKPDKHHPWRTPFSNN